MGGGFPICIGSVIGPTVGYSCTEDHEYGGTYVSVNQFVVTESLEYIAD